MTGLTRLRGFGSGGKRQEGRGGKKIDGITEWREWREAGPNYEIFQIKEIVGREKAGDKFDRINTIKRIGEAGDGFARRTEEGEGRGKCREMASSPHG